MMLVTVLCRFSVHFGKYFPKKTRSNSLYGLGRKWLNSYCRYVAAVIDSLCCCLDSREKLIKAMLQGSGPAMPLLATCLLRIAPGLEAKSAVNFFSEGPKFRIIPLLGNKVSSRNHLQINKGQNLLLERQETLTQIAADVLGGVA